VRRTPSAGAVAAVVAINGLFLGRGAPIGSPPLGTGYVAVLYFENKIDPSDSDQLGDMLTHLVTTELAREPSLSVLSQQRLGETARRKGHADGRIEPGSASEILDGLRRAERALGDREAELELLHRIVARPMLRAWDPILWLRAHAALGASELDAGQLEAGRAHLDTVLTAWGKSELPDVTQARIALSAVEGK